MIRLARSLILFVVVSAGMSSVSHSYPTGDEQIPMKPFWQSGYGEILGCKYDDKSCQQKRSGKSIAKLGCALTSMAMIYEAYGLSWIPDDDHVPMRKDLNKGFETRIGPPSFNQYLSSRDTSNRLLGFDDKTYDFSWLKTTTNFYYKNNDIDLYQYVMPNYYCGSTTMEVRTKSGVIKAVKKSADCFKVDWNDPKAMNLLDDDIKWSGAHSPVIAKINYKKLGLEPSDHTHFVVIGGYEKKPGRDDHPGWYRAHNPAIIDNEDGFPRNSDNL